MVRSKKLHETTLRVRIAALIAGCGLAAAGLAQTSEGQVASEFTTADGSRFVLMPVSGPPLIHWISLTPAGTLEDPAGLEGLSFAVARAAMLGTTYSSTSDSAAEWEALTEEDRLEQEWESLRARGEEIPEELWTELLRARAEAARLYDPVAWERDLRRAPALGARLHQRTEANLLHVTTSIEGLSRVGQLLIQRREGTILRGVHREFRIVRAEQERDRGDGPDSAMRRELLGLSYLGHPLARAYARTDDPVALAREEALRVFHATHHPTRTLNVLTGGFDAQEIQALLEKMFVATSLPKPPPTPPPPTQRNRVERRASLPGDSHPTVTVGIRIPDGVPPDALATLVGWLTDGLDAELLDRLRTCGHPDALVHGEAPFPVRSGGMFLLEVEDPGATAASPSLLDSLGRSLAGAMEDGPKPDEIAQQLARLRSARAAARLGAENLAFQLAIGCGLDGRTPAQVLAPMTEVDAPTVHQLARQLLVPENRTIVNLEVKR